MQRQVALRQTWRLARRRAVMVLIMERIITIELRRPIATD